MLSTRNLVKKYLAIASAVVLPFTAMPTIAQAQDAPTVVSDVQTEYTEEEFQALVREAAQELFDSDLPREVVEDGDELFIVYELEDGGQIGMPAHLTHYQPRVSAGVARKGPWVELTPLEQRMIIGGGGVGTAGALCTISRTVCLISGPIIGAMTVYLDERGRCPNDQRLLLEFTWNGNIRGATCR